MYVSRLKAYNSMKSIMPTHVGVIEDSSEDEDDAQPARRGTAAAA